MERRYGSFLIRCWRLANGDRRVEVEHVQSGTRARLSSLASAVGWIADQEDPGIDEPLTLVLPEGRDLDVE